MKKRQITLVFIILSSSAYPCTTCNKPLQRAIYNSNFYPNLLVMLPAFMVLGIAVAVLSYLANKSYNKRKIQNPAGIELSIVPVTSASSVLGIGLGGFADGTVFHQILQWHEMLSNKVPVTTIMGKSVNMFWDGIFHFFCLLVTLTGVIMLWKALIGDNVNRSGYLLSGGFLLGWGSFNIIEGIIDHHLLKLHNVYELGLNHDIANFGFLGFSVILIIIGLYLIKKVCVSTIN